MKRAVDLITAIALLSIVVGGSMMDSPNVFVPIATVIPGMIWVGARVVITEVFK